MTTPEKKPIDSEGRRRLGAHLSPPITAADLARLLDVTPQAVSGWVSGSSSPGLDKAAKIEALTGIPAASWLADEERAAIDAKVAARAAGGAS